MSFAITAYTREGLVMAADSRLSLNTQQVAGPNITNLLSVGQSDSNQKLFVTSDGVGISTVGAADIDGIPIAGIIEQFIFQNINGKNYSPSQVADEIITYFHLQPTVPDTQFHIAGYDKNSSKQEVFHVQLILKKKNKVNPPNDYGISWAGEGDILARLVHPAAEIDPQNGNMIKNVFPYIPIPYQFFTLQDAIDYCVFAVRTTIETIRFQPRPKTVGGPIDVLVIKPNEIKWIKKKELSV